MPASTVSHTLLQNERERASWLPEGSDGVGDLIAMLSASSILLI
jgi:hypothetical protein